MSRDTLLKASELIQQKRFAEARALLRTISNDPTAQKWLAKLDEIAPEPASVPPPAMFEEPATSRQSRGGLVIGVVGIVVAVALVLVLVWLFVLSDDDDGDSGSSSTSYTDEDLARAVLTLDDMPSGWSVRPEEEEDEEEGEEAANSFLCGSELDIDAEAAASASGQFVEGALAPLLMHGVGAYAGDEASRLFDEFNEVLSTCQEWQDEDDLTWRVAEMSFPDFGDESSAFRISTSEAPLIGVMEMQLVLIRENNLLSVVMYIDIGLDGADPEQTENFARRAYEKLHDISG